MKPDDFDLDQTSPGDDELRALVGALPRAELDRGIDALPHDLHPLAIAVHVEGRSLSDVSQDLGLRQAEVVRGLRRARRLILRTVDAQVG